MLSRRLIDELHTHKKLTAPEPEKNPASNKTPALQAAAAPFAMDNSGANANSSIPWNKYFSLDGCASANPPGYGSLVRGEIMFYQGEQFKNFFYVKKWSHIGVYHGLGTDGRPRVYESNASGGTTDSVKLNLRSTWESPDTCVAFGYPSGTTPAERSNALTSLETTYGNGTTPYNWNFLDKNTNAALYCSQLVWKMFKAHPANAPLNKNLDSNSGIYASWLALRFAALGVSGSTAAATAANLMVAPDEIALHSSMSMHGEGTN